jgi:group I intron endonuclease
MYKGGEKKVGVPSPKGGPQPASLGGQKIEKKIKYGYSNFKLIILEYCDTSVIIKREQYYIDELKPDYNINPTAGSLLGFKHSEYTKGIMSRVKLGLRFSELTRERMRKSAIERLERLGLSGH